MANVSESTIQRLSSTVSRVVRDGQAVYEKQYSAGDWGRTSDVVNARTARECGLVDRLHRSGLFTGRLGLVRIVSAEPERASLVTEEVPGCMLDELVRGRFRRPNIECLSAMWLVGRWLRRFQQVALDDADRKSIGDLDPQDLVEYCRVRLEKLNEYGYHRLDGAIGQQLLETVQELVVTSNGADRRFVWSHADFTPGNIIWDGRMLTPIDFGMAQANRPLLDVTYFLHRLEMQQIYRPWQRLPIGTWKRALLRGYSRPDAESSPMYRACMIKHLLCRLMTYTHREPRDLKQNLHDKWVLRAVGRRLKQVLETSMRLTPSAS